MEPSTETFTEMGRLCVAWSALEYVSEHTLWGILQADEKWGEIISAHRDLEMFWKLIPEHAPKTLTETDVDDLRSIKREIEKVALDRNIIVHGRVHAVLNLPPDVDPQDHYKIIGPVEASYDFARLPCWSIFKGPNAGKSYPISATAVKTVRENIQKLMQKVQKFNLRYGHFKGRLPSEKVERLIGQSRFHSYPYCNHAHPIHRIPRKVYCVSLTKFHL